MSLPRWSPVVSVVVMVKGQMVCLPLPGLEAKRWYIWDMTCWDSFTPTNINLSSTSTGAGLLANHAAAQKRRLYQELTTCHRFVPIAVESTGAFGEDALNFIKEVAKRTRNITKDPLSYLKPYQQISVCIQNFNTASI